MSFRRCNCCCIHRNASCPSTRPRSRCHTASCPTRSCTPPRSTRARWPHCKRHHNRRSCSGRSGRECSSRCNTPAPLGTCTHRPRRSLRSRTRFHKSRSSHGRCSCRRTPPRNSRAAHRLRSLRTGSRTHRWSRAIGSRPQGWADSSSHFRMLRNWRDRTRGSRTDSRRRSGRRNRRIRRSYIAGHRCRQRRTRRSWPGPFARRRKRCCSWSESRPRWPRTSVRMRRSCSSGSRRDKRAHRSRSSRGRR